MGYLQLLDEYEKETRAKGLKIYTPSHTAMFGFAVWLEKKSAQQSAQRTGEQWRCECGNYNPGSVDKCTWCDVARR